MARELTATNRRDAEILQAVLLFIDSNGGEMRFADIKEDFPNKFNLTDKERESRKTWRESWHAILGMIGGIELKSAGLISIKKGVWTITDIGKQSLSLTLDDFYRLYHNKWLEIARERKNVLIESKVIGSDNIDVEEVAASDFNNIESEAQELIRQYIINKNAYQFQDFVAALLRGMGYYTPWIADKGKDGGIDIIAYQDPLGISGSHIKVQVKHYPNTPIPISVVREIFANLTKPNDVGIVATSGRFTMECHKEVRHSHKHIRLLELEDLISLWIQFYNNMNDEDKAILPIAPIYHLNKK